MKKKLCSKCNRKLPLEAFGKNKKHNDGLQYACKACTSTQKRARREARKVELEKIKFKGNRKCRACDRTLHVSAFYTSTQTRDGLQRHCKDCQKSYTLNWQNKNRQRYNDYQRNKQAAVRKSNPAAACKLRRKRHAAAKFKLTLEEYDQLMEQPNCTICNADLTKRKPALDHCHTTGKIRGVLCRQCNIGLGMFHDDIKALQNAIKYLS